MVRWREWLAGDQLSTHSVPADFASLEFQGLQSQVCAIGAPPSPMYTQWGRTAGLLQPAA